MYTFLIILYVPVCILMIVIVLLQQEKGGGLSGIFGSGGGSSAIFGAKTGDVLTKTTTVLAVLFMVLSLTIARVSSGRRGGALLPKMKQAEEEAAPVGGRAPAAEGAPAAGEPVAAPSEATRAEVPDAAEGAPSSPPVGHPPPEAQPSSAPSPDAEAAKGASETGPAR